MKTLFSLVAVLLLICNTSAQRVGINVANPQSQFHVRTTELGTGLFESENLLGTWTSIKNTSTGGREWSLISTGTNNGEGPGHLLFYTGGQVKAIMHYNGNVGIGTTSPAYKLDVLGDTRFTGHHTLVSNSTDATSLRIANTDGINSSWRLVTTGTTPGAPGAFGLVNDNSEYQLTMHQNGYTGIGTFHPTSRLHVRATAHNTILFESNSALGTWTSLKNTSLGGSEWHLVSTGANNGEGPGHLLFYNGGQVKTIMHQNGNVGIGTSTPAYKLDVVGPTRFRGGDHILESNSPGGTWFYLVNTSGTPTGWKLITTGTGNGATGAFTMFNDNNQGHFTLRQNGNAGFGTFDPQHRLHVFASSHSTAMFESESNVGTWTGIKNSSAGGKEWSIVSTGTNSFEGPGHLLFITGGQVVTTLHGNGNVGIGTANPAHRLDINGNIGVGSGRIYFQDRYIRIGVYVNGGIAVLPQENNVGALGFNEYYWHKAHISNVYYNDLHEVSDAHAKKNIMPLGNVLDKIAQLQPIRFDIDPATHPGYKNARPEELERAKGTMGFTAQNIKEVFPSMVVYNEELGVYTIRNYHQLLSVIVQGINEQQSIITALEARIKALEKK